MPFRRFRISTWTLRLVTAGGKDFFRYTYVLVRAMPETETQATSVAMALRHPDLMERDTWREYVRQRDDNVVDAATLEADGLDGSLVWIDDRHGQDGWKALDSDVRRDSGYAEPVSSEAKPPEKA